MDGRNLEDCLAASIAWLTGEDINVLPSDFFAGMYLRTGEFCRLEGWPRWLRTHGYSYTIRIGSHYKGLHVAHFWIDKPTMLHSVVCRGNKVVYDCTDPEDKADLSNLWASMKITKKGSN